MNNEQLAMLAKSILSATVGHGRWIKHGDIARMEKTYTPEKPLAGLSQGNTVYTWGEVDSTIMAETVACVIGGVGYVVYVDEVTGPKLHGVGEDDFAKTPEDAAKMHEHGFTDYIGEREVPKELHKYRGWTGNQIENRYSHFVWRNYASCFWDDIRISRTVPNDDGRDDKDEKHMHPLQLDVIERGVEMWTNPGEVVLTPFMGVGSEVYGAVVRGRVGVGAELKESYFRQAARNCEDAVTKQPQPDQMELFS